MSDAKLKQANSRVVRRLLATTVLMFAFGYALVPLYNVFCEITGLNGKTGRLTDVEAAETTVDMSREVTIEFVTNVSSDMPWEFRPLQSTIKVHPGVETMVEFEAINIAQYEVTGSAVPSVAPSAAARYFNKTECFCFSQQSLAAGETKVMPVRFIVDPGLPQKVKVVTLAYTFFESLNTAETAPQLATPPPS
jgi:cytochrome c oxidase assembly protein subunit 11